jgi:hypothetical protein
MNELVFNKTPDTLKAVIYGADGSFLRAVSVDSAGRFLISPDSAVAVTADGLDIRPLSSATDSVLVTADGLDIRPLSGENDSVTLYGNAFVEDTVSTTLTGTSAVLTRDISAYSENSFFIRNLSATANLSLAVQVSPVSDADFFTTVPGGTGTITGIGNFIGAVTIPARYARLQVTVSGIGSANVVAYYNGRA